LRRKSQKKKLNSTEAEHFVCRQKQLSGNNLFNNISNLPRTTRRYFFVSAFNNLPQYLEVSPVQVNL